MNHPDFVAASRIAEEWPRTLGVLATVYVGEGKREKARKLISLLHEAHERHWRTINSMSDELAALSDDRVCVAGVYYASAHEAAFDEIHKLYCLSLRPEFAIPDDLVDQLEVSLSDLSSRIAKERALILAQGKAPPAVEGSKAAELLLDDEDRRIMEIVASDQSTDAKMRAICGIDGRYLGWKSPRWAELLKVKDAAIRKTAFWKALRGAKKSPD